MPPEEDDGPKDLYEEISNEQTDKDSCNNKTDGPIPSCYAYAVPEFPPNSDQDDDHKPERSTPDPQTPQSVQGYGNKAGNTVTAYAVSGITVTVNKKTSRSFSTDNDNRDVVTSKHASRHFSDSSAPQLKKKKPKPMPKKVRGLVGVQTNLSKVVRADNQQGFSASVPEGEKYSKLNPKTQYMGLEPHTGTTGKKTKVLPSIPKEDYSHLKH